jgi:hypothetical protein
MQAKFVCVGTQSVAEGRGICIDLEAQASETDEYYAGGTSMILKPEHSSAFIVGHAYIVEFKEVP